MDDKPDNLAGDLRNFDQAELSAERTRRRLDVLTREQITALIGETLGFDLNTVAGRARLRQLLEYLSDAYGRRDKEDELRRWVAGFYERREKVEAIMRWSEAWMGAGGGIVKQIGGLIVVAAFGAAAGYFAQHLK